MNEKNCNHEFTRISNCWFHWNTGEPICIGRCIKCSLTKVIEIKDIKINEDKKEKVD